MEKMHRILLGLVIATLVLAVVGAVFGVLAFVGVDVDSDVTPAAVELGLTEHQLAQLRKIEDTHVIDATQWGYLTEMDQPVDTAANTIFKTLHTTQSFAHIFTHDANLINTGPRPQFNVTGTLSLMSVATNPALTASVGAVNFQIDTSGMLIVYTGTLPALFRLSATIGYSTMWTSVGPALQGTSPPYDPAGPPPFPLPNTVPGSTAVLWMHTVVNGVANATPIGSSHPTPWDALGLATVGAPFTALAPPVQELRGHDQVLLQPNDTLELALSDQNWATNVYQIERYEMHLQAII